MATAPAAEPLVACPYTAGGCPLFQTVDVADSQRCAGSCSPAAPPPPPPPARAYSPRQPSSSSSFGYTSTANKRTAPPYFTAEDAAFLSELTGEVGSSLPAAAAFANDDSSWAGYLDFGISPNALEVPYMVSVPEASSSMPSPPLDALPPLPPQLWDLEDLLSRTGPGAKRVRTTPPPVAPTPFVAKYPHTDVQVDKPSPPPPPQGPTAGSPTSTDEDESEVVTVRSPSASLSLSLSLPLSLSLSLSLSPLEEASLTRPFVRPQPFISKLSYLLQHPEFEPWVRWDPSGQYLLVAHTKPHLLQILERFFRHTVTSSFIRQLNVRPHLRSPLAPTRPPLTLLVLLARADLRLPPRVDRPAPQHPRLDLVRAVRHAARRLTRDVLGGRLLGVRQPALLALGARCAAVPPRHTQAHHQGARAAQPQQEGAGAGGRCGGGFNGGRSERGGRGRERDERRRQAGEERPRDAGRVALS